MCAATAAAVGTVAATAATIGTQVYSATKGGGGGGGGGAPQEKQLAGFAPTKNLQSYASRLLALNATKNRPTLQEYAQSGGTARFPITDPGLTPAEAMQMRLVDPRTGKAIPYYNPDAQAGGSLTPAQQLYQGHAQIQQGNVSSPQARYALLTNREEAIRGKMAGAGTAQSAMLAGRLANVTKKRAALGGKLGMQ